MKQDAGRTLDFKDIRLPVPRATSGVPSCKQMSLQPGYDTLLCSLYIKYLLVFSSHLGSPHRKRQKWHKKAARSEWVWKRRWETASFLDMVSTGFILGKPEVSDLARLPRPIRSELMPHLTKGSLSFTRFSFQVPLRILEDYLPAPTSAQATVCSQETAGEARLSSAGHFSHLLTFLGCYQTSSCFIYSNHPHTKPQR